MPGDTYEAAYNMLRKIPPLPPEELSPIKESSVTKLAALSKQDKPTEPLTSKNQGKIRAGTLPRTEDDLQSLTKGKKSEGSNEGYWYTDNEGSRFLVKAGQTPDHIYNEVAVNVVLQSAGAFVKETGVVKMNDGKLRVVSRAIDPLEAVTEQNCNASSQAAARKHFGIDVLTSNWDAFGLPGDPDGRNYFKGPNGNYYRIDNGGGGFFRAMGGPKDTFKVGGWKMTEETKRDYNSLRTSPQGKLLYGAEPGEHDDEINASLVEAASLDLNDVQTRLTAAGVPDDFSKKFLDVLADRQTHLKTLFNPTQKCLVELNQYIAHIEKIPNSRTNSQSENLGAAKAYKAFLENKSAKTYLGILKHETALTNGSLAGIVNKVGGVNFPVRFTYKNPGDLKKFKFDKVQIGLDNYINKISGEIRNLGRIEMFFSGGIKSKKFNAANDFKDYIKESDPIKKELLFNMLHSEYGTALTNGRLGDIVKEYDPELFKKLSKPYAPPKSSVTRISAVFEANPNPATINPKPPEPQKSQPTPEELKQICREKLQLYKSATYPIITEEEKMEKAKAKEQNLSLSSEDYSETKEIEVRVTITAWENFLDKPSLEKYTTAYLCLLLTDNKELIDIIKPLEHMTYEGIDSKLIKSAEAAIDKLFNFIERYPSEDNTLAAARKFEEYMSLPHQYKEVKSELLNELKQNHAAALTTGKLGEIVKKIDGALFTELENSLKPTTIQAESPRRTM